VTVRTVNVDGGSVSVRCNGAPDARAFVFWHGLGHAGNGSFLDVAVPPLLAAGCATYAVDGPGFGGSDARDPEAYAVDALARVLWGTVDALGLSDPILSGHSWGGSIALASASQRPADVGGLVLFDSGHVDYRDLPDARPEATMGELIAELEADPVPDTWDELVALLAEHDLDAEWTLAAWREGFAIDSDGRIRRRATDVAIAAASYWLMRASPSAAWPAIAAAGIPTLVLLATEPPEYRQSNAEAGERMHVDVPHADIRPIEGMRHAVFADLGASAGTLVADWLREQRLAGVA
jgi:pimeloyl-ACP methyl ester carboxylesterase